MSGFTATPRLPERGLRANIALGADAALLAATACFAALAVATSALPQGTAVPLGWLVLVVTPAAGLALAWWLHAESFRPISLLVLLASCVVAGGLGTFVVFAAIGLAASKLPTGGTANVPYYVAAALPVLIAVGATMRERRVRAVGWRQLLIARVVAVCAFAAIIVLWFVPYARSVGDPLVFIGFVLPVVAGYVAGLGAATAAAFEDVRRARKQLAEASKCPSEPPPQ